MTPGYTAHWFVGSVHMLGPMMDPKTDTEGPGTIAAIAQALPQHVASWLWQVLPSKGPAPAQKAPLKSPSLKPNRNPARNRPKDEAGADLPIPRLHHRQACIQLCGQDRAPRLQKIIWPWVKTNGIPLRGTYMSED